MAAFFIPVVMTEREIAGDAEEYAELRKQLANTDEPILNPVSAIRIDPNGEFASFTLPPVAAASAPTQQLTSADLTACKAANDDFIGWLQIPNTTVDYPVVWSDDSEYYLSHTFAGKKSYIGSLFSLGKTDFQRPSQNIAIYGHHIRSNAQVMFSPLTDYKDQAFYADHKTIYFDTLYHGGTYSIFAVLNMHNGDWEPSTADFSSDMAFLDFVGRAKAQALYDTGVEVQATNHILTLITCDRTYGGKDGRLVVMAVEQ